MKTREQWLNQLVAEMSPWFEEQGRKLPAVRVSVGFPSTGKRSKRIGECWTDSASADGTHEIFITPTLDDTLRIADVLAHELCHAAVGVKEQHNSTFKQLATAIGLQGKMTATIAGPLFKERAQPILDKLGKIPHARLDAAVSSGPKKQTTRLLKAVCPQCGYTVRVTRTWLAIGLPICPTDNLPMSPDGQTERKPTKQPSKPPKAKPVNVDRFGQKRLMPDAPKPDTPEDDPLAIPAFLRRKKGNAKAFKHAEDKPAITLSKPARAKPKRKAPDQVKTLRLLGYTDTAIRKIGRREAEEIIALNRKPE